MGLSLQDIVELAQRGDPSFEHSYKEILNCPASCGCSPKAHTQPRSRELICRAGGSSRDRFCLHFQGREHRSLQQWLGIGGHLLAQHVVGVNSK